MSVEVKCNRCHWQGKDDQLEVVYNFSDPTHTGHMCPACHSRGIVYKEVTNGKNNPK